MYSGLNNSIQDARKWLRFIKTVKPKHAFKKLPVPEQPDYANIDHWAVHPENPGKSYLTPQHSDCQNQQASAAADVFFLHPTTFFGQHSWNAPVDHVSANEIVDEVIIPSQATVFNSSCRIFAPRYRQATFYSFVEGRRSSMRALELAYEDVQAAFDFYIQHYNQNRPFFIAGHSQGTLHGIRLLEERIEKTSLAEQLIAAYLIGFQLPEEKFKNGSFTSFQISKDPADTGCVLAWDTYLDTGGPMAFLDRTAHWHHVENGTGRWQRRRGKRPVCINPLSWTSQPEKMERGKNLGAVHPVFEKPNFRWADFFHEDAIGLNTVALSRPLKAEVSAECREDGYLYISKPTAAAFSLMVMPRGNYHNYDYSLFYMNIRENIANRLKAFLK